MGYLPLSWGQQLETTANTECDRNVKGAFKAPLKDEPVAY
jgi:hypothetical protein